MFNALLVNKSGSGLVAAVQQVDESQLPPGDTLIDVEYSSVNYKDGLAVTGKGKIIRGEFPFVPGIDLAGVVVESPTLQRGVRVAVTGWGIGEKQWGGFAARARVKAEMCTALPDSLTTRDAMVIGTAGVTAMLSVFALEEHGAKPGEGEIVVSGATGGVGSLAVALLAARRFNVVASTGSSSKHEFLTKLGASRVIERTELPAAASKPMDSARWKGAIDTVGSNTLAGIISQLEPHASVAACGNAAGFDLQTTVFPFILRGVNLLGIDSNWASPARRRQAWDRLATDLGGDTLRLIEAEEISLADVPRVAEAITNAAVDGRVVVDVRR
jgi:acrylyl-CoA reductase (NADPH)